MDRTSQHINQWKHNRELICQIPCEYPDWIVTIVFYTALHAVDALFAYKKIEGKINHKLRNEMLMTTHQFEAIRNAYLPLYDLSRTVRYLANPAKWIPIDEISTRAFSKLYGVEASVQKLMGKALNLPKLTLLPAPSAPVPTPQST